MNQYRDAFFRLAPGVAAAFLFLLFALNTPFLHWSDSEIWGLRQASACWSDWGDYACGQKPLFHVVFGAISRLVNHESITSLMDLGRGLTIVSWLATLVLALRFGMGWPLLLIFLGTSVFFLDTAHARSDVFALPFLVWHAGLSRSQTDTRRRVLWVLSALVAVALTPKCLATLACLSPLWLRKPSRTRGEIAKIGAAIAACAVAACFFNWTQISRYFFGLFSFNSFGFDYFNVWRLLYVFRASLENPLIPLVLLAWLVLRWRSWSRLDSAVSLQLLLIAVYPDRLPFWLGCEIFLILFLIGMSGLSRCLPRLSAIAATVSVALGIRWFISARADSNAAQRSYVAWLESALSDDKHALVYDGLGLAPRELPPSWYFGPGESNNGDYIIRMKNTPPDVIVVTHRIEMELTWLQDFFDNAYIQAAAGVYVLKGEDRLRHRFAKQPVEVPYELFSFESAKRNP